MSSSKIYDKLLEKATSPLLLDVDWESILKMCDLVRQGDVQTKYALGQLKKKLSNDNIHVLTFSLNCLESLVKNCGSKVHQEVATKDFMDIMRNIAGTKSDPVKSKVLELIQCWSHAFKKNPNYRIVEDYFNAMKLEGFQFQPLKESEAMFDVEEAPAWKEDSECSTCYRCRTEFSTLRRRHHCRACGQIFCNSCSSKTSPIPKFGIEKEVRVCDTCYDKINRTSTAGANPASKSDDQLPAEYINSPLYKEATKTAPTATSKPAEKSEQEFQDEINLALAISQSEAEAQEQTKRKKSSSSKTSKSSSSKSNWQESAHEPKSNNSTASAPYAETVATNNSAQQYKSMNINNNVVSNQMDQNFSQNAEEIRINNEMDEFVEELKKLLELYINRMKSDSMRGRSITNDTAVQSLFLQLQHLHPKLLSYIKYQEDARGYYENLQDKLTQLKDAREALNALRLENFEKKRRENEERERLRQMQISQKLQIMRQQKQSYYLYQNQLNLQRLQEQERDLQMRLVQQRELVLKRDQNLFSGPGLPFKPIGSNDSFTNVLPNEQMMNQYNGLPSMSQVPNSNSFQGYQAFNNNGSMLADSNLNTSLSQKNGLPQTSGLEAQFQSLQLQQQNLSRQNMQLQMQQQQLMMQQQPIMSQHQQPVQYQQWPQQVQQSQPTVLANQQTPNNNIQYSQYSNQVQSNGGQNGFVSAEQQQQQQQQNNLPTKQEAQLISFD